MPREHDRATTTGRPPLWRDVRVLRVGCSSWWSWPSSSPFVWLAVRQLPRQRRSARTSRPASTSSTARRVPDPRQRLPPDRSRCATRSSRASRNTLRLAVAGIVLATVLGTLDRHRPAVAATGSCARAASVYVEVVRNIPLLVLFVLFATSAWCCSVFPRIEDGVGAVGPIAVLSNRGIARAVVRGRRTGAGRRASSVGRRRRWLVAALAARAWPTAPARPARSGLWAARRRDRRARRRRGSRSASASPRPSSTAAASRGGITMTPAFFALAVRARRLHGQPHRRDRARLDPGRAAGPGRGGRRARPVAASSGCGTSCCPRRSASPSRRSATSTST